MPYAAEISLNMLDDNKRYHTYVCFVLPICFEPNQFGAEEM